MPKKLKAFIESLGPDEAATLLKFIMHNRVGLAEIVYLLAKKMFIGK